MHYNDDTGHSQYPLHNNKGVVSLSEPGPMHGFGTDAKPTPIDYSSFLYRLNIDVLHETNVPVQTHGKVGEHSDVRIFFCFLP